MKKATIFALFLFFSKVIFAQYTIKGNIIDSSNKLHLFGSSIHVENSDIKTISNEEGDFEVRLATLPAVIVVGHVGYKKTKISVNNTEYLKIKLVQEPIELAEVRVGNPAISILNAVVEKARLIEAQKKYYSAFYRRISTNDGSVNRIQEVFMNVSWGVEGVIEWQPVNIRYAKVNPPHGTNVHFLNFLFSAIYHKFDGFVINSIEIGRGYTLKVKNYINIGSPDEIAVISFESANKQKNGYIYVKTKKDQLLKIIENEKTKSGHGFGRTEIFEANFRENVKGETVFDNIFIVLTVGRSLDFRKEIEKTWFYFRDEIPSFENGNTIYPAFSKSDAKIMLSVPYNANYWQENTPFPATENIKKMIKKMEQSDKFTSNFN